MRKVFYNSKIAKILFNKCHTITLMAWVFTKWSKEEAIQSVINHECVHTRQWIELTVAFGLLVWIGMLLFGYSAWWVLLAAIIYYVWYVTEYAVRLILLPFILFWKKEGTLYGIFEKAYENISFEREARMAERDNSYLENSDYFAWIKFLF